jgi:two-component system, NarL family, response regulator DevR
MSRTRVLLVDDHEVVRLGLMTLINDQADMEVVGEAGTADEALKAVEHLRPDVVLMDIRLPGEGGLEATERITRTFPESRVVVLTSFADDALVVRAIQAGAAGYVLKQVGNKELLRAIQAAARGQAVLDPTTTQRLLARVRESERRAEQDAFRDLSDREMAVLAEVARGRTNAETGRNLHLSEKTVRNYVSTILEKLHMANRIELATYAVEHHIFDRLRPD